MAKEQQHYIPRSYIKLFANNEGKVWVKDLQNSYQTVKLYHPAGFGYENDFYRYGNLIFNQDLNTNPNYVEKAVNKEYEDKLQSLIDKFTSNVFIPSIPDRLQLSELIIHLKRRSRYFREKTYSEGNFLHAKANVLEKFFENPDAELVNVIQESGQSPERIFELGSLLLDKGARSPEYRKDMHINSLAMGNDNRGIIRNAIQIMATGYWEILDSPIGTKFIASDNPGFLIDSSGQLNNLGVGNMGQFYFPLNPKKTLLIVGGKPGYNPIIARREITTQHAFWINRNNFKLGSRFIFSADKHSLLNAEVLPKN